jgi:hypothetical protein
LIKWVPKALCGSYVYLLVGNVMLPSLRFLSVDESREKVASRLLEDTPPNNTSLAYPPEVLENSFSSSVDNRSANLFT